MKFKILIISIVTSVLLITLYACAENDPESSESPAQNGVSVGLTIPEAEDSSALEENEDTLPTDDPSLEENEDTLPTDDPALEENEEASADIVSET